MKKILLSILAAALFCSCNNFPVPTVSYDQNISLPIKNDTAHLLLHIQLAGDSICVTASGTYQGFSIPEITQCTSIKTHDVPDIPASDSYTVVTEKGATLGINGKRPVGGLIQSTSRLACGAASDLGVKVWPTNTGNAISSNWTNGSGTYVGVFINGQLYVDPGTGYGLYGMVSGIWSYCKGISGGIQPNETFKIFVRTYCNPDTTGSVLGVDAFDSPITTLITSSTLDGTCTTGTTKKGKGK